eukprot:Lankesteria_metandrocarpae@DN2746_c0_g1_i2.p1
MTIPVNTDGDDRASTPVRDPQLHEDFPQQGQQQRAAAVGRGVGRVSKFSYLLLGEQIGGIWHSGVVVYGHLYHFFGGAAYQSAPEVFDGCEEISPVNIHHLGYTKVQKSEFLSFLREFSREFTTATYDILERNCNHFSQLVCTFLLESMIPHYITDVPLQVKRSSIGRMVVHAIRSFDKLSTRRRQKRRGATSTLPTAVRTRTTCSSCDTVCPDSGSVDDCTNEYDVVEHLRRVTDATRQRRRRALHGANSVLLTQPTFMGRRRTNCSPADKWDVIDCVTANEISSNHCRRRTKEDSYFCDRLRDNRSCASSSVKRQSSPTATIHHQQQQEDEGSDYDQCLPSPCSVVVEELPEILREIATWRVVEDSGETQVHCVEFYDDDLNNEDRMINCTIADDFLYYTFLESPVIQMPPTMTKSE